MALGFFSWNPLSKVSSFFRGLLASAVRAPPALFLRKRKRDDDETVSPLQNHLAGQGRERNPSTTHGAATSSRPTLTPQSRKRFGSSYTAAFTPIDLTASFPPTTVQQPTIADLEPRRKIPRRDSTLRPLPKPVPRHEDTKSGNSGIKAPTPPTFGATSFPQPKLSTQTASKSTQATPTYLSSQSEQNRPCNGHIHTLTCGHRVCTQTIQTCATNCVGPVGTDAFVCLICYLIYTKKREREMTVADDQRLDASVAPGALYYGPQAFEEYKQAMVAAKRVCRNILITMLRAGRPSLPANEQQLGRIGLKRNDETFYEMIASLADDPLSTTELDAGPSAARHKSESAASGNAVPLASNAPKYGSASQTANASKQATTPSPAATPKDDNWTTCLNANVHKRSMSRAEPTPKSGPEPVTPGKSASAGFYYRVANGSSYYVGKSCSTLPSRPKKPYVQRATTLTSTPRPNQEARRPPQTQHRGSAFPLPVVLGKRSCIRTTESDATERPSKYRKEKMRYVPDEADNEKQGTKHPRDDAWENPFAREVRPNKRRSASPPVTFRGLLASRKRERDLDESENKETERPQKSPCKQFDHDPRSMFSHSPDIVRDHKRHATVEDKGEIKPRFEQSMKRKRR